MREESPCSLSRHEEWEQSALSGQEPITLRRGPQTWSLFEGDIDRAACFGTADSGRSCRYSIAAPRHASELSV
jgi:hypothetical protein